MTIRHLSLYLLLLASPLMFSSGAVFAADNQSVRPEVGKPLQEAQQLYQAKKYRDSLVKVDEAQKAAKLTSYESYIVQRMRVASAVGAGDYTTAINASETLLASGQLTPEEKLQTLEALVGLTYTAKDYPKAIATIGQYRAAGGGSSKVVSMLPELLYLSHRYGEAAKEVNARIAEIEKNGQAPAETQIKLLASCALKQNDDAGYIAALEKMVIYHPNDSYWLDLIVRTSRKPGFSPRLSLDVYRLRYKTGTLRSAGDYLEAAQLALQDGLPTEAEQYVKQGYDKKLLGQGPANEVDRHKRLKERIARDVSIDSGSQAQVVKEATAQQGGDALFNTGLNYVGNGQYEKGLPLMEQGMRKGGLKKPETTKLRLGYAQLLAGKKDEALKTLKSVQGDEGERDLARLWTLLARSF